MDITKDLIKIYFTLGMFANVLLFLIQAVRLFKVKDSAGLSFITFIGFNLIQLSTILYGIIERDYLLTFGYILSFLACGMVSILILLYRKKTSEEKRVL